MPASPARLAHVPQRRGREVPALHALRRLSGEIHSDRLQGGLGLVVISNTGVSRSITGSGSVGYAAQTAINGGSELLIFVRQVAHCRDFREFGSRTRPHQAGRLSQKVNRRALHARIRRSSGWSPRQSRVLTKSMGTSSKNLPSGKRFHRQTAGVGGLLQLPSPPRWPQRPDTLRTTTRENKDPTVSDERQPHTVSPTQLRSHFRTNCGP